MTSDEQHQTAAGDPDHAGQPPVGAPGTAIQRRRVLLYAGAITLAAVGASATALAPDARSRATHPPALPAAAKRPGATAQTSDPTSNASTNTSQLLDPAHPACIQGDPSPNSSQPPRDLRTAMRPVCYVDDAGPDAIALTLDDGPHPVYTPQVLAILAQYGILATFNMIGSQIAANLSLVREVAAAGHTITNHTWNHADMRAYTLAQTGAEIDRCNDILAAAEQEPTIFRAPYGYWTDNIMRACASRCLTPLGWSVDPRDWDTAHVTTYDIVRNVLYHTRPHDIILEHDGGGDRSNTVAALRIFIPELIDRGYRFAAT